MADVREVSILGSTGTIGQNVLDVISNHREKFRLKALSAGRNAGELVAQAKKFHPEVVAIIDEGKYQEVKSQLLGVEVIAGSEALLEVASQRVDVMISAITGFAGLAPTMKAIGVGSNIALANKESLVCAGDIMIKRAAERDVSIIPIDSEHNAIFQILQGRADKLNDVSKVILTASGGPFLNLPAEQLEAVTPEEATAHPNWNMGAKISVDSATMMNKGLELVEAKYLFNLSAEKLGAIIHPESVIHSLVHFNDGSVLAQAANPDMRIPISYALGYPERLPNNAEHLDLANIGQLNFREVDLQKFKCLQIALDVLKSENNTDAIYMNAANEEAVANFLSGQINFNQIAELVQEVMQNAGGEEIYEVGEVDEIDEKARAIFKEKLHNLNLAA